jgi:protein-tyrosine-phosphatase
VKKASSEKNVLFVCIENSNRSQMAEAFAKMHGRGIVNAYSAGSRPSGKINPRAIEAMKLIGYDLAKHQSKSTDEMTDVLWLSSGRSSDIVPFDYVITMGCGDECPFLPAIYREDWDIPDPKNLPMKEFIVIRNLIELKVKELLKKIKTKNENRQEIA